MTIAQKTARGAFWNIGAGLVSRAAGLLGTVIITHHLSPGVVGEVAAATILALTANFLSAWGLNQYVIVRGESRSDVFHASILHLAFGFTALAVLPMFTSYFSDVLNAPHLASYLPGMLVAMTIKRISSIPEKLLVRDLRFRTIAVATACGELVYISMAVGLVTSTKLGGQGIVIANIIQATFVATVELSATGWRPWLTPSKWNWDLARRILRFGGPLGISSILSESSRYWDKLLMSRLFGPHAMGAYSLSYNLADLPATYVGEHVATVLFPTFVRVDTARRHEILSRAVGLLTLIIMPMAVGIAVIAPALVAALFTQEWRDVAPFLMVLATVALFRPVNSVVSLLFIASEKNKILLLSEVIKVVALGSGIWLLSRWGPVTSASAIGLAMGVQFVVLIVFLGRAGMPLAPLAREISGPLAASTVMAVAVVAAHAVLTSSLAGPRFAALAVELAVGVLTYAAAAWIFARGKVVTLASLLRDQIGRRRGARPAPSLPSP